jgi:hypothetical protein
MMVILAIGGRGSNFHRRCQNATPARRERGVLGDLIASDALATRASLRNVSASGVAALLLAPAPSFPT